MAWISVEVPVMAMVIYPNILPDTMIRSIHSALDIHQQFLIDNLKRFTSYED